MPSIEGAWPSHSLNVRLRPDIMQRLRAVQAGLAREFTELRWYDSTPHLSVATKFMPYTETERYARTLRSIIRFGLAWTLEFAEFCPSSTGDYVFLELSRESQTVLKDLHGRILQGTRDIGSEEQTVKLFRSFSYSPHISVMKVGADNVERALGCISESLRDVQMRVNAYDLVRHENDASSFPRFPVYRSYALI